MHRLESVKRCLCAAAVAAAVLAFVLLPTAAYAAPPLPTARLTVWAFTAQASVYGQNEIVGMDGIVRSTLPSSLLGGEMSWSPDGTHYALAAPNPAVPPSVSQQPWDIFVVDADGSNPRSITGLDTGPDSNPQWSPRGDLIMFNGHSLERTDGTGRREIPGSQGAFSPDGTKIAYVAPGTPYTGFGSVECSFGQIHIMNVDGTGDHPLFRDCKGGLSPSWSPDGKRLSLAAYYYPPTATHWLIGLFTVAADGTGLQMVHPGNNAPPPGGGAPLGFGANAPARWSPDGNWLLIGYDHGLALIAVDGATFYAIPRPSGETWGEGYWDTPNAQNTPVPVTRLDVQPPAWSRTDVTLRVVVTDDGSGTVRTFHQIDGGDVQEGTIVLIPALVDGSNDGIHTVAYYSTDAAGNAEAPHFVSVGIDTQRPSVTSTRTPQATPNGWNSSDVTVSFDCDDGAGSGIASCPQPVVVGEGADADIAAAAVDNAGNTAQIDVTGIRVDETPPVLSGRPTTSPNLNGWYDGPVTIRWACTDVLSGIRGECPPDDTITGEGSALSASASVSDVAGNVTSTTSEPVAIDRTPPLTSVVVPSGWVNAGVTVGLTALDNLSGVAATQYAVDGGPRQEGTNIVLTTEGVHRIAFSSVDRAGNVEPEKTVTVRIDTTAPTISHTLTPQFNGAGWNQSDVTVSFLCDDALSGIAACSDPVTITTEGLAQRVEGRALDNAGNSTSDTAFVSIDKTPPTITAQPDRPPKANDWYNADVQVSYTCADALSGITACSAPLTLHEGARQIADGSATDAAGNTATASTTPINIDETPPIVAYSGNAGSYTVDQSVSITCAATDEFSGVASTTCADVSGPAWSFGLGTTSRSASATDRAGNTGTGSTSFAILVTAASLENLIRQFVADTHAANGLIAKVDAISAAPNRNVKSGALGAFDNEVAAKTGPGKPLTADDAARLEQLAGAL